MSDPRLSSAFVTNVTLALTVDDASYVDLQEFQTHIIVLNAHGWRRTEMVVPRSSILVPVGRTYSMRDGD